ncbi:hypothetical protein GCM10010149_87860 [Nonomuraea roseoviolacea subsp. roseoviolacea]|uniref:RNA ligase family protein n=1 Tax=Nonomuraea roseoviolacea TaxID=103837 RepID=UPI0031D39C2B
MFITSELRNKLNSLTKYPKIPTYHQRDSKGLLVDGALNVEYRSTDRVHITEKFDGENTRITLLPTGEYMIGSREEWLTISGDRLYNEKDGLVDAVRPYADSVPQVPLFTSTTVITTFYVEVYGHRATNAWKNYGDGSVPGVRLFDVAQVPIDMLFDMEIEEIAAWRENADHDGIWASTPDLYQIANLCGFTAATVLDSVMAADLPKDIDGMRDFLYQWPLTTGAISGTPGRSEGIVINDFWRKNLAKVKFKDYDKVWNARAEENRLAEKASRQAAFAAGRRGE